MSTLPPPKTPPTGAAGAAGATSATARVSAPQVSATAFKPTKPKFGNIAQTGHNTWSAWTGGKPNAHFSGLEDPNPKQIQPNQYQASSATSQAKSQSYRIQGLDTKFTRESNLLTFQKKVLKHLTVHGLDAITYLPDPTDATKTVSVIDNHSRFNLEEAIEKGNKLVTTKRCDGYDLQNIDDAKQFLINSISPDLETQLYQSADDDESFIS